MQAAMQGDQEAAAITLVDRGPDIRSKDEEGMTPLHHAVVRDWMGLAKVLLQRLEAADLAVEHQDGGTVLQFAATNGHPPMVELLLDNGADINRSTASQGPPLHQAAAHNKESLVQLLLSQRCKYPCKRRWRRTRSALCCPFWT